jgi:hypothetical protein
VAGADSQSEETLQPNSRPWHVWFRWGLALLVALLGAAYFLHGTDDQAICHRNFSQSGIESSEICGPPRLLDLAPFGLVIAVLLWPDLSEVNVAGLLTLKRRLRRQEARQEGLEDTLSTIQQHLTQLSISTQNQSQAAAANVYLYPPDQEEVRRGIVGKEGAIGHSPNESQEESQGDKRQVLLGEFLQEYARLEPFIFVPGMHRFSKALDELNDAQISLVERWNELFSSEIGALRQTRNVVVHEPERVSDETLVGALDNTKQLSRILFERLDIR